jgi:phosphoenolpyruvate carboxylase
MDYLQSGFKRRHIKFQRFIENKIFSRYLKKIRNALPTVSLVSSGIPSQEQRSLHFSDKLLVRHGLQSKLFALLNLSGS